MPELIDQQLLESTSFVQRTPLRRVASAALRAAIVLDFVTQPYGAQYGVRTHQRAWLARRFFRNVRAMPSGTTALAQLIMAREILAIPPTIAGAVVECGSWKGASTAALSLVCGLVGRRLLVYDSFQGLPDEGTQLYLAPHSQTYGYLKGGMFQGTLAEVQANVRRFGRLDACVFVPGMFADTMQPFDETVAFAFVDVDLPTSFQTCLRALWPALVPGGLLYADDVSCMNVAQVFFDANAAPAAADRRQWRTAQPALGGAVRRLLQHLWRPANRGPQARSAARALCCGRASV